LQTPALKVYSQAQIGQSAMFRVAVPVAFALRLASGTMDDFPDPWVVVQERCGDEEGSGEQLALWANQCQPAGWNGDLSVIYTCGEGANITQEVFANQVCRCNSTILSVEPGVCLSGPLGEQIKWTCYPGRTDPPRGLQRPVAPRGALRGAVPELAAASGRPAAWFIERELCGAAIGELQRVWAGQCQPLQQDRSRSVIYTCAEDGANVTGQVFENAVCSGTPLNQIVELGTCSDTVESGEQARWSCSCGLAPPYLTSGNFQPC